MVYATNVSQCAALKRSLLKGRCADVSFALDLQVFKPSRIKIKTGLLCYCVFSVYLLYFLILMHIVNKITRSKHHKYILVTGTKQQQKKTTSSHIEFFVCFR